jgi:hypothetical protein
MISTARLSWSTGSLLASGEDNDTVVRRRRLESSVVMM